MVTEASIFSEVGEERTRYASEQYKVVIELLDEEQRAMRDAADQTSAKRQSEITQRQRQIDEVFSRKQALIHSMVTMPAVPPVFDMSELTLRIVRDWAEAYPRASQARLAWLSQAMQLDDELLTVTGMIDEAIAAAEHEVYDHASDQPQSPPPDNDTIRLAMYVHELAMNHFRKEHDLLESHLAALRQKKLAIVAPTSSNGPRHAEMSEPGPSDGEIAAGPWRVTRVIDGDTIEITLSIGGGTQVLRLLNVNAPEEHQPGFYEAKSALERLVHGREVALEFERAGKATRDRNARICAFVFVDSTFVNYELIKGGYSAFVREYGASRYAHALEFAASSARNQTKESTP